MNTGFLLLGPALALGAGFGGPYGSPHGFVTADPGFSSPDVRTFQEGESSVVLWRAWLDSPGGELPFLLEIATGVAGDQLVTIRNGEERIPVPVVNQVEGEDVVFELAFPHYDATIRAKVSDDALRMDGEYAKRLGPERWRRLPFHAVEAEADTTRFPRPAAPAVDLGGRWRIDFSSSDDPAVGVFEQAPDGTLTGTILTTTGDYRFLAGSVSGSDLRLSVFDAAHAFLFHATAAEDGSLRGDFWSGDTWHETWTATRDDDVVLANAFEETRWFDLASLADVLLPDADGTVRSLTDPALRGKATLVVLFGTWCPNCHDEAAYLAELEERYGDQGLRIVGLAFEFTGEFERDAEQLRRFRDRYEIEYPLLLAGTADKADATLAFPGVDFVRSYPTTLFVDEGGHVRWVHSGFNGPATGTEHATLRAEFEGRIEALLAEAPEGHGELVTALPAIPWRSDEVGGGANFVFTRKPDGDLAAFETPVQGGETVERAVRLVGRDAVWIDDALYRLDPIAQVLVHPASFGKRLMPSGMLDSPLLIEAGYEGMNRVPEALLHEDPRIRREAIWSLGRRRMRAAGSPADEFLPYVADPSVEVAIAAVWAVGATGDLSATDALAALREHPNARMRREVARGLVRFARMRPAVAEELAAMEDDPDPLVRAIVGGSLR